MGLFSKGNSIVLDIENNTGEDLVINEISTIGHEWLSGMEPRVGNVLSGRNGIAKYGNKTKSSSEEAGFVITFNDAKGNNYQVRAYNNGGTRHQATDVLYGIKVQLILAPDTNDHYVKYFMKLSK